MTTAFVLSGGGSLGAVQVGMLRALAERGIVPDVLVGTSVGALNAAFLAGHGTGVGSVAALEVVWSRLTARAIFSTDPLHAMTALAGRRDSLCTDAGLRRLLDPHLTFDDLADAPIPLVVIATDLLTGEEVPLTSGDATEAILASAAIPAVFPTVQIEGRVLTDGGLANNTAISQAVELGADTIYVLPSGYPCAVSTAPGTPLGVAAQALTLLIHQRLVADVARYSPQCDLVVLPPPCPLTVAPTDFGRSADLVAAAHRHAVKALSVDGGRRERPDRLIAMHTHDRAGRPGRAR